MLELEVARTICCFHPPIWVDNTVPLMDVVAQGAYDRVNTLIGNIPFPTRPPLGQYRIVAQVLFLKVTPDTPLILGWLERQKLQAGGAHDLLALAAHVPSRQLRGHIIALGSTWYDSEMECGYALCLQGTEGRDGIIRRELDLADIDTGFTEHCGFLVYDERIRKGGG